MVGFTDFTYRDVCAILSNMERDFRGAHYHLLRKNCNHFSNAFVEVSISHISFTYTKINTVDNDSFIVLLCESQVADL